ncbi:hypothetical protein PR202_ga26231 [Eleusine coracana subsp. coracana]|uniref:PWI domain-containing protein n=1 Tax=Eleusine coracana subsp. coracana TaxID=191504 RepID=A0AAV5DBD4_ELECO|nr:hypothetical protein PR202_ga26231 [Eleusine coracana subsp. coracana]
MAVLTADSPLFLSQGTSADQDTRFSNKQAKLLKSQKFPPELDHLVDMSKVKMDVMKPWIAKRVTDLGFEDEVLINFIYGLLEEKEADGKKIQIQLTGFMEKNTVKFMKELWNLLLSAQQNASGVPQQFLDAKEAEIQQRKAEDDRIAQEIQKKREKDGRDSELEKQKMMVSLEIADPGVHLCRLVERFTFVAQISIPFPLEISCSQKITIDWVAEVTFSPPPSFSGSCTQKATVPIPKKSQATVPISWKAQGMVSVSFKTPVPIPVDEITKTPQEIPRLTENTFCKPGSLTTAAKKPLPYVPYCLRNQERRSDGDDDVSDVARKGGHMSPDSEQRRLPKFSRFPERNSMRDRQFTFDVKTSYYLLDRALKSPRKHIPTQDSTDTSADEEENNRARENSRKANSARRKTKDFSADMHLKKVHDDSSPGERSPVMSRDSGKSLQKPVDQLSESSEEELAVRRMKRQADSPDDSRGKHREDPYLKDGRDSEHVMRGSREDSQSEDGSPVVKTKKRADGNSHIDSGSSGSEESERHRSHSEKRRRKKAHKHNKHNDDSSESDSELDDKEAKRRRKEEKRLRKEERRQRREERHRRRAERHASKQKKHIDVSPPSDLEKDRDSDSDADVRKRDSHRSREESDPKKLEIELREKALESLRAKKAINH